MAVPASTTAPGTAARDHGFHVLRVARVEPETAEASSFVLDVPDELREAYAYAPGQFCTFRVDVDGTVLHRCYSMSSAPPVDDELRVTVKRVPGGTVSNWLVDHVEAGTALEVSVPAGVFCLGPDETELVAFAAGSGITPVLSLLKAALHDTHRRVRLLYANRDRDAVIFSRELETLGDAFGDRLEVTHHLDVDRGFVDAETVRAFVGAHPPPGAGYYLCGPAPFMDVVEDALGGLGAPAERIHIERFTPAEPAGEAAAAEDDPGGTRVTIELDGRTEVTDHHPGATILQTARQVGMSAPSSCESGSCATCMARLVEGTVEMHVNDALTDEEVAEGWILTCQSVPTSAEVSVRYGYD